MEKLDSQGYLELPDVDEKHLQLALECIETGVSLNYPPQVLWSWTDPCAYWQKCLRKAHRHLKIQKGREQNPLYFNRCTRNVRVRCKNSQNRKRRKRKNQGSQGSFVGALTMLVEDGQMDRYLCGW